MCLLSIGAGASRAVEDTVDSWVDCGLATRYVLAGPGPFPRVSAVMVAGVGAFLTLRHMHKVPCPCARASNKFLTPSMSKITVTTGEKAMGRDHPATWVAAKSPLYNHVPEVSALLAVRGHAHQTTRGQTGGNCCDQLPNTIGRLPYS